MIEDILYKELVKIVGEYLANKDGIPAIFYKEAPPDTDGWKGEKQYPRLDYYTEYKYNSERNTSGTLVINIWQLQNKKVSSEDIAEIIRPKLDGLFITDDIGTISLAWNITNSWSIGKEAPLIAGSSLIFDIYAYPVVRLPDGLDPIYSISQYSKEKLHDLKVIGIDELPETYKGNILYWYIRDTKVSIDDSIYACTWIDTSIIGQLAGDNIDINLAKLSRNIALDQEFILEDTSPFFVEDFKTEKGISTGQVTVLGRYGVLRNVEVRLPLTNIYIKAEIDKRRVNIGSKKIGTDK